MTLIRFRDEPYNFLSINRTFQNPIKPPHPTAEPNKKIPETDNPRGKATGGASF